jgi:hypothetical protein
MRILSGITVATVLLSPLGQLAPQLERRVRPFQSTPLT